MTSSVQNTEARRAGGVDPAQEAIQDVLLRFTKRHEVSVDRLGPEAQKAVEALPTMFAGQGSASPELRQRAYEALLRAHQADCFEPGVPPVPASPQQATIPTTQIMVQNGDGHALAGAAVNHHLSKLLQRVGLKPDSFSADVAKVIDDAQKSPTLRNLSDPDVWATLARRLRAIAVREGSPIPVAQAAARRGLAGPSSTDPDAAGSSAQGLGLAKRAARTASTGSQTNATSIRAQLLAGIKAQDESVDVAASRLADEFLKTLAPGSSEPALRTDVVGVLRSVLRDPRSADGAVGPTAILANACAELDRRAGATDPDSSYRLASEFAQNLHGLLGERALEPSVESSLREAAFSALHALAGVVAGRPEQGAAPRLTDSVLKIFDQLGTGRAAGEAGARARSPQRTAADAWNDAWPDEDWEEGASARAPMAAPARGAARATASASKAGRPGAPLMRAHSDTTGYASEGLRPRSPLFRSKSDLATEPVASRIAPAAMAAAPASGRATPTARGAAGTPRPGPTPASPRADAPGGTRPATPLSPASREVAAQLQRILQQFGVDAADERARKLEPVLRSLLGQSSLPGVVARKAVEYLAQNAGLPVTYVAEVTHGLDRLASHGDRVAAARNGLVKQIEEQRNALSSMTDPASRAQLSQTITSLETHQKAHDEELAALSKQYELIRDETLRRVGQSVLDPDGLRREIEAHAPVQGAAPAGVGAASTPAGGVAPAGVTAPGPVGAMPGEPRWFERPPVEGGALPGIFGGTRPKEDAERLSIQHQRAVKCAEILEDPSLSIEDKIFLFMMWFVAFTDRERERQLEEIVGIDRDQARRASLRDKTSRERDGLLKEEHDSGNELRQVNAQIQMLRASNVTGPELEAAESKAVALKQKVEGCKAQSNELLLKLQALSRDSDKAPSSREVKFTELQRLSQLRDNILNMARSIMETSNRNIEKVFR